MTPPPPNIINYTIRGRRRRRRRHFWARANQPRARETKQVHRSRNHIINKSLALVGPANQTNTIRSAAPNRFSLTCTCTCCRLFFRQLLCNKWRPNRIDFPLSLSFLVTIAQGIRSNCPQSFEQLEQRVELRDTSSFVGFVPSRK